MTKIYVWCNTNCQNRGDWHSFVAVAEDGKGICGHLCSHHGFARHDMGFTSTWKHEHYDKAYPEGWELVMLEPASNPNDLKFILENLNKDAQPSPEAEQAAVV